MAKEQKKASPKKAVPKKIVLKGSPAKKLTIETREFSKQKGTGDGGPRNKRKND